MVAASFAALMLSSGLIMYSYSVIAAPIELAFNASRTSMMLGMASMMLAGGVVSPFLGGLLDRVSMRRMMLVGISGIAVGHVLLSMITAVWQLPLIYAVCMMLGNSLLGPLLTSTLLARWFSRKRGLAMGVATIGTSVGGFVFPPLMQWAIDTFGWRDALRFSGIGTFVLMLPIALTVASRPEDKGLHPDGGKEPLPVTILGRTYSFGDLARERNFWLVAIVMSLLFCAYTAILSNLVPLVMGGGLSTDSAALQISILALAGIVGKILFGTIADRVDLRFGLAGSLVLVSTGFWLYAATDGFASYALASTLIGLATGGMLPVWGSLLAVLFGAASYGRVMGMMNPLIMPLTLLGPPMAGVVYDQTGSYSALLYGLMAALLLATLLLPQIRMPSAEVAAPAPA